MLTSEGRQICMFSDSGACKTSQCPEGGEGKLEVPPASTSESNCNIISAYQITSQK